MTNFSEYANKNMWGAGLNLMLSCRHLKVERLKIGVSWWVVYNPNTSANPLSAFHFSCSVESWLLPSLLPPNLPPIKLPILPRLVVFLQNCQISRLVPEDHCLHSLIETR